MTLAAAGCRLPAERGAGADRRRVDLVAGVLVLESLRKRRRGVFRAVPLALLEALDSVHGLREAQSAARAWRERAAVAAVADDRLARAHAVMASAGLSGPHASPKGLRHGFGVATVGADVLLNLVQKWLGHAQLSTTAIYADALGAEEHEIVRRMWE